MSPAFYDIANDPFDALPPQVSIGNHSSPGFAAGIALALSEPASVVLLGVALLGVLESGRRRRRGTPGTS